MKVYNVIDFFQVENLSVRCKSCGASMTFPVKSKSFPTECINCGEGVNGGFHSFYLMLQKNLMNLKDNNFTIDIVAEK